VTLENDEGFQEKFTVTIEI